DDGDLAAKSAEHLPELQPDIAAAHDEEVPGKKINVHHRAVGEASDLLDSRHRRHDRAATDIDEDPIRHDPHRAHADVARRLETGVAPVNSAVFHFLQPGLEACPGLSGDGVLPRLDPPHVYIDAAVNRHA